MINTQDYRGAEIDAASGDSAFVFEPAEAARSGESKRLPGDGARGPLRVTLGHEALLAIGYYRDVNGGVYTLGMEA